MVQRKAPSKSGSTHSKVRPSSLVGNTSKITPNHAAAQGKKKRKHNQKFLDERQREQVDRDVAQVLHSGGRDGVEDEATRTTNPFAYPLSNVKEQRKTAKQIDQTLEAFDLLMK